MIHMVDQIPEYALDWHHADKGAVLATVVETWGSAPRAVGAQMVVSRAGDMAGSVSGGCVEGAVVAEALDAVRTGQAQMLEYGVSDDDAFAVGLACGGRIKVWLEPVCGPGGPGLPEALLADLVTARAARVPVAYIVDTATGARRIASADADHAPLFRQDRSTLDGTRFTHIHNPPLRLIVVGAVHIAQALVPMARVAGYDPVVIDPRDAFAAAARFPGETILTDWPDEAMAAIGLDARTAVVTLSHDPKIDDPAICAALASDALYLGCLGSTRTHAKRLDRLRAAGVDDAVLARIHAPVGLSIGARGPAEIAVSILAELTRTLRLA